jgi:hypothetical protein
MASLADEGTVRAGKSCVAGYHCQGKGCLPVTLAVFIDRPWHAWEQEMEGEVDEGCGPLSRWGQEGLCCWLSLPGKGMSPGYCSEVYWWVSGCVLSVVVSTVCVH